MQPRKGLSHGSRRSFITTAAVAALTGTTVVAPLASADDVEGFIANAEALSREASATNEQVLAIESQISELEENLVEAGEKVNHSQEEVDRVAHETDRAAEYVDHISGTALTAHDAVSDAKASLVEVQRQLDRLAAAKYRGIVIDPLTNATNAKDPQSMIDRLSYMNVLGREAQNELAAAEQINKEAGKRATKANAAVAEAQWARTELENKKIQLRVAHEGLQEEQRALQATKDDLEAQREALTQQREALAGQIFAVQSEIDGLSGAELDAWRNKDNPIDPSTVRVASDGVVASALSRVGSPYQWGGTGPSAFDCSGLMVWSYQQQGKNIPRTSQAQIAGGQPVAKSDLQPGDIVGFYSGVTHVGMYIGNGQVVHASDYGVPVQVVALDSMPFAGAARY